MRQLDNAAVSVETSASGVKTLVIEASTGEQFLVELVGDRAASLAAALNPEPAPAAPKPPASAPTPQTAAS